MGHQSSETHDKYRGQPDAVGKNIGVPHKNPLPPLLNDHLNQGPTKVWKCMDKNRLDKREEELKLNLKKYIFIVYNYTLWFTYTLIELVLWKYCVHDVGIYKLILQTWEANAWICIPCLYLQELPPTAVNRQLQGKPFSPQNQAILFRNEPYMTTNDWYHRTFSKKELNEYPKKDVPTYWQCEDYPKAWGFGMKENPLPPRIPNPDATGPMRDRIVFTTTTTVQRQPQSLHPIPEWVNLLLLRHLSIVYL